MWIRCNPNTLGKTTGDCVVRAIAIATDHNVLIRVFGGGDRF